MDGTCLRPGHAKIAPAGFTYGDAIPAPEGYTFLEIFESHPGAKPCYSNPRHQRYFEEVHGEVYAGVFGYLNSKKDAQNAPTPRKPAEIIKFDEPDDTWVKTGGLWTKCVFVGDRKSTRLNSSH